MISTALDHLAAPPSSKLLGWHLIDARPREGWVRIGFDGKPAFCNPAGFIQGGILSAMLDDTMGPAVFVMTEGKLYTATITMTVNFLAPAKPGPITGEADVTQLGKTIAFMAGRLTADDGTVLFESEGHGMSVSTPNYDVMPDGRFIMLRPLAGASRHAQRDNQRSSQSHR
jgi:uncharacterized protein (TIGR00369 family)